MWSFGAPSKEIVAVSVSGPDGMIIEDYLFAPGGNAYEQANSWLTPVAKVDMTNLKFATAQRAGATDSNAVELASHMRAVIVAIDALEENNSKLAADLKGINERDREAATEFVTAKKRFDAATELSVSSSSTRSPSGVSSRATRRTARPRTPRRMRTSPSSRTISTAAAPR